MALMLDAPRLKSYLHTVNSKSDWKLPATQCFPSRLIYRDYRD